MACVKRDIFRIAVIAGMLAAPVAIQGIVRNGGFIEDGFNLYFADF